jgi:hypothetical protein
MRWAASGNVGRVRADIRGARVGSIVIAAPPPHPAIEVVRGRTEGPLAESLLAFWAAGGALSAEAGQARLAEVVCVLRGAGGEVGGISSAYPAELALVSGRRLWIYRSLSPGASGEDRDALLSATFGVLEAEFDAAPGAPLGLCALVAGAAERRRRPEAVWVDPPMFHAGFVPDGRQARIAYFPDASILRSASDG